jgi:hypothetical protein
MKEWVVEGAAKGVHAECVSGRCRNSRRFIAYGNDHDGPREEKAFFQKDTGIKTASINICLCGMIAVAANCAFCRDASIFHTGFLLSGLDLKREPAH